MKNLIKEVTEVISMLAVVMIVILAIMMAFSFGKTSGYIMLSLSIVSVAAYCISIATSIYLYVMLVY